MCKSNDAGYLGVQQFDEARDGIQACANAFAVANPVPSVTLVPLAQLGTPCANLSQ